MSGGGGGGDSAKGTEQDAWEHIELETGVYLFKGYLCSEAREKEEEMALVLKRKRQEKKVIRKEKKEYMRKKTEAVTRLCGKNMAGVVEGDDDSELRAKIEEYNNKLDELEIVYLSKKNEVENAEKEWNKKKETVDRLDVEWKASNEKLEMLLGSFVTNKWVEITYTSGLTALEIMKDCGNKLRFCIGTGIDKEYYQGMLQIAQLVGIEEPSSGILYDLNEEGVFTRVPQEECLALGFQMKIVNPSWQFVGPTSDEFSDTM